MAPIEIDNIRRLGFIVKLRLLLIAQFLVAKQAIVADTVDQDCPMKMRHSFESHMEHMLYYTDYSCKATKMKEKLLNEKRIRVGFLLLENDY